MYVIYKQLQIMLNKFLQRDKDEKKEKDKFEQHAQHIEIDSHTHVSYDPFYFSLRFSVFIYHSE